MAVESNQPTPKFREPFARPVGQKPVTELAWPNSNFVTYVTDTGLEKRGLVWTLR